KKSRRFLVTTVSPFARAPTPSLGKSHPDDLASTLPRQRWAGRRYPSVPGQFERRPSYRPDRKASGDRCRRRTGASTVLLRFMVEISLPVPRQLLKERRIVQVMLCPTRPSQEGICVIDIDGHEFSRAQQPIQRLSQLF